MRLLVCLLLAALAAAPADAQRRRDRDDGWFARRGDAALTFSIDALTVDPVEGGVGGRFWLSDRAVATASLGFGYARLDRGFGDDVDALATVFGVGLERHFGRSRRVSPFVGAAVSVGHASFDYEDVYYPPYPYPPYPCPEGEPCPAPDYPTPYPYTRTVSETSLGASGLLGAEVRLAEGVTVMLAHRLGIVYARGEDGGPIPFRSCEECFSQGIDLGRASRRFELGTGTTALTLSVYL